MEQDHLTNLTINMNKIEQYWATALTSFEKLQTGHKESAITFRAALSDISKVIKKARKNAQLYKRNIPKKKKQVGVELEPEHGTPQTKYEQSDIVGRDILDKYF